jgi:hypothetical protein
MANILWASSNSNLGTYAGGASVSGVSIPAVNANRFTIIAGNLPSGLSLSSVGVISGTVGDVLITNTSTFVVRAFSIAGQIADKTFNITVTNASPPVWSTPAGFIAINTVTNVNGTAINDEQVSIQLTATSPENLPIVYELAQGSALPAGLHLLTTSGYITGVISETVYPGQIQNYNFSVEAVSGSALSTQTFNLKLINPFTLTADDTIIGFSSTSTAIYIGDYPGVTASTGTNTSLSLIQAPEFLRSSDLGELTSNSKYYIPVTAYDPDPLLGPIIYSVVEGEGDFNRLPQGLSLDPGTGFIYGYLTTQTNFKQVYSVTIKATKYDKISKASIYTTNTFALSTLAEYFDVITWVTTSTLPPLAESRISQLSVEATHLDTEWPLYYRWFGGDALPPGLTLTTSGDIVGSTTASGTYTIAILACTSTYLSSNILLDGGWGYTTEDQLFSVNDFVMDAGSASAVYDLDNSTFVIDGGGATNNYDYNLDGGNTATIYDVNSVDIDAGSARSVFTVTNLNIDGGSIDTVYGSYNLGPGIELGLLYGDDPNLLGPVYPAPYSIQDFTLTIVPGPSDYTDIYVRPLLKLMARDYFSNFINNTSIFVPSMLYRGDDPNFGLQTDLRMYLEFGVTELNLEQYVPAVLQNFYTKSIYFGNVGVALAKDSAGNVIYEVVYVQMVDPMDGVKPTVYLNHCTPYYPASVDNMRLEFSLLVVDGQYNPINSTYLPEYMQTFQNSAQLPGYQMVVPLCYVTPGNGSRIVNNILHSGFDFKLVEFEFDRLVVVNSLDNTSAKYIKFPRQVITDRVDADSYLYGNDGIEWIFDDGNPLSD